MYGDEGRELGPSELFNETDAKEVLADAEFCIKIVKILFDNFNIKSK
ncbi:MAG: hypothetical protein BAJALOKI3v1_100021 [Promethearchaeota archaeon]|nr:MAG: hypothetical protein BAJALOKI3v1_100021 [Candidatus Lokiarchaeota archaeon]